MKRCYRVEYDSDDRVTTQSILVIERSFKGASERGLKMALLREKKSSGADTRVRIVGIEEIGSVW